MAQSVLSKSMRAGEKMAESVCDIEEAKAAISAAVDDGVEAARRAVRHGRHVAEDLVEDATRRVRRYPLQTVAATFGVAMGAGLLLGWLIARIRE